MRLVHLEARDFAQWSELDLDLTATGEVVIVGENGAGKSRLLDAVLWSLYGRPARGTTDRLIRRGQRSMSVRTTWQRDGHEYVIGRARSTSTRAGASSLTLTIDDVERSRHTIGETQAEITRLFGPLEVISAGPVMAQGASDALMRADPRERKDLLGRLFGVEQFEAYHEAAKATWQRLTGEEQAFRTQRDALAVVVATTSDVGARLADALASRAQLTREADEAEQFVISLREKAAVVQERAERIATMDRQIEQLNDAIDRRAARVSELDGAISAASHSVEAVIERVDPVPEQRLVEARLLLGEERRLRSDRAVLGAKINHLKEALEKAIVMGLCDHCPYRVDTGEYPELERLTIEADNRLGELGDTAAALERLEDQQSQAHLAALALEDRQRAEQQVAGLRATLADLRDVDQRDNNEVRRLNAERTRLRQDLVDVEALPGLLQRAAFVLTEARVGVKAAEAKVVDLQAQASRRTEAEREQARLDGILRVTASQREAAEWVTKAFHRDGIPALILEHGIPQVEARANAILGRMPGGLRLSLVTQRETKVGTLVDTLEVVVETEGVRADYDTLSGGERFRVDLALRLGLSDVLSRRTGAAFQTLWLDEAFSAQDRRALEGVLEALATVVPEFGLVAVITHQDEVAERFPTRLRVVKMDGLASLEAEAA